MKLKRILLKENLHDLKKYFGHLNNDDFSKSLGIKAPNTKLTTDNESLFFDKVLDSSNEILSTDDIVKLMKQNVGVFEKKIVLTTTPKIS